LEATERRLGQLVRELGGFIREDRSLEMRAKMQQLLYWAWSLHEFYSRDSSEPIQVDFEPPVFGFSDVFGSARSEADLETFRHS